MGYKEALEAAGAVVHCYKEFGSYQGDWWATVTHNGISGWIHDYFGSCSGCDAFEAEFIWGNEETPEKLAEFGKRYLEEIISQEEAEKMAAKNIDWDTDAKDMLKFIQESRGYFAPTAGGQGRQERGDNSVGRNNLPQ